MNTAVETTIAELLSAPEESPVPLRAIVALAHAIDTDRHTMGLYGMPDPYRSPVTLVGRGDESSEWMFGPLRYLVDDDWPKVVRLCTNPSCGQRSISTTQLTRVCIEHLNTIVPGLLPNAGDDTNDADRAAAAEESRAMRLDSWAEQITEARRELDGDARVIESLRRNEGN
ncbi:hypothetical protein [Streptomyces sp. NPDC088727]|uniref:hypothetical protein n=1 Tax=Streptomyces sp. NPDC088727 TaxID=3365875 RepID=UPI00380AD858